MKLGKYELRRISTGYFTYTEEYTPKDSTEVKTKSPKTYLKLSTMIDKLNSLGIEPPLEEELNETLYKEWATRTGLELKRSREACNFGK